MEQDENVLCYFKRLLDLDMGKAPAKNAEMWDKRAEAWEKEYRIPGNTKTDDRVQDNVDYLIKRGILDPDCDVVDVGCGPGRFAAAFARTARYALGIDFSEKMIQFGAEYVKRENLPNVAFKVCDFRMLDIERENLTEKFDLVFSSNTPAIYGSDGLKKMMRMSRKYCFNVTPVHSENDLESRIMRDVFGRDRHSNWDGRWFYSIFNLLFLTGYYPEASYYKRHSERDVSPGADYAKIFMELALPPQERTHESEERICDWMRQNADADGSITEVSDIWYGRLLWDIRRKTEIITRRWPL